MTKEELQKLAVASESVSPPTLMISSNVREQTRTYPDGALDVLSALDEARCLTMLAIGHPDRAASLWHTHEALDLLQRIVD